MLQITDNSQSRTLFCYVMCCLKTSLANAANHNCLRFSLCFLDKAKTGLEDTGALTIVHSSRQNMWVSTLYLSTNALQCSNIDISKRSEEWSLKAGVAVLQKSVTTVAYICVICEDCLQIMMSQFGELWKCANDSSMFNVHLREQNS